MNPNLEALFNEPEKAYLRPDELNVLSQFVSSLPERINLYRRLRNDELALMQAVADTLQQQFSQASEAHLERSLQNGVLVLRCAAMAMLMDDPDFMAKRLKPWLPDIIEAYGTQPIDEALYELLKQQLSSRLAPNQKALLFPGLETAQALLSLQEAEAEAAVTTETLVGLF